MANLTCNCGKEWIGLMHHQFKYGHAMMSRETAIRKGLLKETV